jgi:hypothetical protein
MGSYKYLGQVGGRSNVAVRADLKVVWEEVHSSANSTTSAEEFLLQIEHARSPRWSCLRKR